MQCGGVHEPVQTFRRREVSSTIHAGSEGRDRRRVGGVPRLEKLWGSCGSDGCLLWPSRYGLHNRHNGQTPREHWLTPAEHDAILHDRHAHAPEGYRRMAFTMLDTDVVAVSPATVYRVLKAAGVLQRWNGKASRKETGFVQPLVPHEHWHIDMSDVNLAGTLYSLGSILDEARRMVAEFVRYYHTERLHSAIGFVTPANVLAGRASAIWTARDHKPKAARAARRALYQHTCAADASRQRVIH